MTDFKPNLRQQEAIDTLKGPVMLLAGPGTGKTFTLIKRIEKMLELGVSPETILCLTFSDAASNEMKTRLVEKIGAKAAGVNVSTYHSFCMEILRQNPAEFEMTENVQMADDVTKQAILKEAVDEFGEVEFLKDKWGNKYFYIPNMISGIETIKRERVTKETYFEYLSANWEEEFKAKKLELKEREEKGKPTKDFLNKMEILEKKIGKAREFWGIFEIYRRKLSENGLIDYSDMINLVLDKMEENSDFLKETCGGYKYLLVDEYQDTSKVQNDLIFNVLRGGESENVFVVGDDDQIIYSFQGARSSNLADFLNRYKNAKVICLEENRRSAQNILDFGTLLIENDPFRLNNIFQIEKKLIAKNPEVIKKEEKIKFNIYSELVQENNAVVDEVETLIKSGIEPKEIAILSRRNDSLENFARLLTQREIPFALSRKKNAFEIPSFIQAYFYLKILVNSYLEQDKLFGLLSFEPFKIDEKALAGLLFDARKTDGNFFSVLQNSDLPEIKNFCKTYNELVLKKSYTPLVPLLYEILMKTGILGYYSNNGEERFENVSALNRLIDEAQSFRILHKSARLNDFVAHLDTYFKKNIKIELQKSEFKTNSVQLLTYHGSKGREFEHVFLPNLTSKCFEKSSGGDRKLDLPVQKSKFSKDKAENTDAELLRLLFVGVTRAKYGLHLSYANAVDGISQCATKYISGLFPTANPLVEQKIFEIDEAGKIDETVRNLTAGNIKGAFWREIEKRVQTLVISQTSLNKYINCPLQYFYSDILEVPVFIEDKDILSYGSAIHSSIEFMTKNALKTYDWGECAQMYEKFKQEMDGAEFSSPERKTELLERGKKSIEENFYKLKEASIQNILSAECRMELEFEGHLLKGFADRITKDNDGKIHIFDFKTGSYKKVRQGENYYNQLRFYKFLYESLHPEEKVGNCALIFFEEGCKISCPDEDLTSNLEIKEKIREVISEIRALNFEPRKTEENCRFCAYKLVCKLYCAKTGKSRSLA